MVDLGSDASYEETSRKLKRYWNVHLSSSSIQTIVNKHSKIISENIDKLTETRTRNSQPEYVVGESDGTMLPLISVDDNCSGDRRKTRKTYWGEARLSLAYEAGDVNPKYAVSMQGVDEVGNQLVKLVKQVGAGKKTQLHFVGDGAPWIAAQVEKNFGSQATYLIDYYHLSEYLNKAGSCCNPEDPVSWARQQGELMKMGEINSVLSKMEQHIKYETIPEDHVCGAEVCYNYLTRRLDQLNYKKAIENDLPIGSGKIEGGHKSVLHSRVKIPGAWWRSENAAQMFLFKGFKS